MSAIELLAGSVEAGHGREFTVDQLKELAAIYQSQQYELMNQYTRNEALTRVAVIALSELGGSLTLSSVLYDEATSHGLEMSWDEEGDIINVKTYEVVVPDMPERDIDAIGTDDGDQPSVSDRGGAEGEVASEADDKEEG